MSYAKANELQALVEILEIAKLDLHRLLIADHAPFDISYKIETTSYPSASTACGSAPR